MKKLVTLVVALGSLVGTASAQDLNSHYLYQLNPFNINPALAGGTEGVSVILNPGSQWTGLDGSPTNSMFGVHTSWLQNMGVGGKVVIDKRGLFTNMSAEAVYSYKVDLATDHTLRFGVSAGVFQNYLNVNTIINDNYTDETDPTMTSEYYNGTHFLAGTGLMYSWKALQVGVSAPHLVLSGRDISDHIFATAKYDFAFGEDTWKVSPIAIYQQLSRSPDMFDGGVKGMWNDMVWAQVMYRSNSSMVFASGVSLGQFNLGYAYNMGMMPLNVITTGSHEVVLGFVFNKKERSQGSGSSSPESVNSRRLKTILNELQVIEQQDQTSSGMLDEIKGVQKEISVLLKKSKSGEFTDADEARLEQLSARIKQLKQQVSGK